MGEFNQLVAVAKYEVLKQTKRRRFHAVFVLTILIEVFFLLFAIGTEPTFDVYIAGALFALPALLLGGLAAIFFTTDAIAGEYPEKTGYVLFPNPIRYRTLVIGKFIACLILTILILLVVYGFTILSLFGAFGQAPPQLLLSLGHAAIFLGSVVAMTLLFSSKFEGGMRAAILMMILFIVVFPFLQAGFIRGGIGWTFPTSGTIPVFTSYLAMTSLPFLGVTLPYEPWSPTLAMIIYLVIFISGSVILTKRRSMT